MVCKLNHTHSYKSTNEQVCQNRSFPIHWHRRPIIISNMFSIVAAAVVVVSGGGDDVDDDVLDSIIIRFWWFLPRHKPTLYYL